MKPDRIIYATLTALSIGLVMASTHSDLGVAPAVAAWFAIGAGAVNGFLRVLWPSGVSTDKQ